MPKLLEALEEKFFLKYDGPLLASHRVDLEIIGPALSSVNTLFKEANRVLNEDQVDVKVFLHADIKPNCVTFSIQLFQTTLATVGTFLERPDVVTIKTLLEWLVLGGGGAVGTYKGGASLLHLLKWKSENKVTQSTKIKKKRISKKNSGSPLIEVSVKGNNNVVIISPELLALADDPKVVRAAKAIIAPVAKIKGIESASFYKSKSHQNVITKKDAVSISTVEDCPEDEDKETVEGYIQVHKPELSLKAKKWSFVYNGVHADIDISSTTIAKDIMKRGKIVIGDTWRVRLRIVDKKTKTGIIKTELKVMKVLDFIPGPEQGEFALVR